MHLTQRWGNVIGAPGVRTATGARRAARLLEAAPLRPTLPASPADASALIGPTSAMAALREASSSAVSVFGCSQYGCTTAASTSNSNPPASAMLTVPSTLPSRTWP